MRSNFSRAWMKFRSCSRFSTSFSLEAEIRQNQALKKTSQSTTRTSTSSLHSSNSILPLTSTTNSRLMTLDKMMSLLNFQSLRRSKKSKRPSMKMTLIRAPFYKTMGTEKITELNLRWKNA